MLEERFERFSEETKNIGTDRLQIVNAVADQLISTGHGDTVLIAEWKSRVNASWEDLLELLQTRKEVNSPTICLEVCIFCEDVCIFSVEVCYYR